MTTLVVRRKTPHGAFADAVARAMNGANRRWRRLAEYGNPKSAGTIRWMVENGKGLRAFEAYPPGTFEAYVRNETEVWFRRAE